jgi:hypothetical protein
LKHVEFHSKNKFEKLMHLVGFILRNQALDCGGGMPRKIIQRLCQGSQHGPHRYEAVSVNHSTVAFAAFHFILFK